MPEGVEHHESLTFVHFSDTHIVRPGVRLREVDTCHTLAQVVDAVNRLTPQPAFVVIGGDLVSPDVDPEVKAKVRDVTVRDYEASYEVFHSLVNRLAVPVHFVMGNHDRRVPFRRVVLKEPQPWDRPYYYAFAAGSYRICVLDSLEAGKEGGYLRHAQLAWLRKQLREHADRPTLLIVHHHTVPVGARRLDEIMLINAGDLWRIVREGTHVCAMLCGHVHLSHEEIRDGVPVFTTPSTCVQVSQ
ncbi:MAG: metallophosphoesterase, partial [Nitrospinae bacterium]|nr:metallophosphoesterase [Nitrospinota bacterium]